MPISQRKKNDSALAEDRLSLTQSMAGALIIELILLLVFVYQLSQLIQINFDARTIKFAVNPTDLVLAGLSLTAALGVYFILLKKQHTAYTVQSRADRLLRSTLKRKLLIPKDNPQMAALILVEIVFAFIIATSIAFYLDPEHQLINWAKYNVQEPLSTGLNVLLFLIVFGFFAYLYNFTKSYRAR